MMLSKIPSRIKVLTVGMAISLTIASVLLAKDRTPSSAEASEPVLRSISAEMLNGAKIVLERPTEEDIASVGHSRDEALAWSKSAWRGTATFPEVELARVSDIASDPPVTCLCWVVVVESEQLPYLGSPVGLDGEVTGHSATAKSWIRFDLIDAVSGKYLYSVEHADWENAPGGPASPLRGDDPPTDDPPVP